MRLLAISFCGGSACRLGAHKNPTPWAGVLPGFSMFFPGNFYKQPAYREGMSLRLEQVLTTNVTICYTECLMERRHI